jgi:ABC-type long-subunit fatty acid transport system fused permease/ATPase subunit
MQTATHVSQPILQKNIRIPSQYFTVEISVICTVFYYPKLDGKFCIEMDMDNKKSLAELYFN